MLIQWIWCTMSDGVPTMSRSGQSDGGKSADQTWLLLLRPLNLRLATSKISLPLPVSTFFHSHIQLNAGMSRSPDLLLLLFFFGALAFKYVATLAILSMS
ncbi:hypothetical protein B0H12DRAFT_219313 [Mycena haematopus]|nr:hypothetical protein B0H12DRAFT_219313 [Mycena haematopus]